MARHTGEYFIDVEGIAVASVLSLQAKGVDYAELDAPKADRFATDDDASLSQEILDISMAEVKAIVEPDSIGDDIWWKSVALVCVHSLILDQINELTWQYPWLMSSPAHAQSAPSICH